MRRTEWRWNGAIPLAFIATILVLGILAALWYVERPSIGERLDWRLMGLAIVVFAGILTLTLGMLVPVGVAFDGEGVRFAYLHRREFVMWAQILALEYHVDSTVTIETSHRSISLGIPGKAFVAALVREMRIRKRRVRTPMPEEYPDLSAI